MKVLTVCNGGNVRSVALARLLRRRKIGEVLVCGVADRLYRDDTLAMLFGWAEWIYIQKDSLARLRDRYVKRPEFLAPHDGKFDTAFDVGPDDWQSPDHPDLLRRLRDQIEWLTSVSLFPPQPKSEEAMRPWFCRSCGVRQANPTGFPLPDESEIGMAGAWGHCRGKMVFDPYQVMQLRSVAVP